MVSVTYEIFMALIGFGALAAAIAPALAQRFGIRLPLSLPMACLLGGLGVGIALDTARLDLIAHGPVIQRVTEVAVLVALTGCGLKLDRPPSLRGWGSVWRLLGITMPLSIALVALAGWGVAGYPAAAALLLGAALAPTDPVLASSVQVGPPGEREEAEARFALTAEAGLNDGLAFPFVHLALAAAAAYGVSGVLAGDAGRFSDWVLREWLLQDVLWRLGAGLAAGWVVGRGVGWLVFRMTPRASVADAFLAFGLTLFSYGVTEMAGGYGFVAVFVAALSFRRVERGSQFHNELHHFAEQTETLLMIGVVFVAGIAIAQGALAPLGWRGAAVALLALLAIRPFSGWVALAGAGLTRDERFAVSVLGIRGVGSFYYISYGLAHAPFSVEIGRQLWGVTVLAVAISVFLHGLTAPRLMAGLQAGGAGLQRLRRRG